MRQKKPQIILYEAWSLVFDVLPDEKAGQLIKAIFAHVKGEQVEPIAGLERVMSEVFETIDEDMKQYEKKCIQMRENINKRYSNEEQKNNNCTTSVYKSEGNNNNKNNNKNKEQEQKQERDKGKSERFTPPTLEECRAYWKERGFYSDPDEFFYFYDGKGWKVGKDKMQKWHSSAALWEKRKLEEHPEIKTKKNLDDYDFSYLEEEGII